MPCDRREIVMALKLRQLCTVEEAVAAFGRKAEFLCDRQFAILPTSVLCFATIGDPATETHVRCPSCVVWKPHRLDYDPSDEYPWLPEAAREVWDRPRRKKLRDHHVLVRLQSDVQFFYAGKAHLGSFGGPVQGGTPAERNANFSLEAKLPREAWLRLGGYPGWLVDINHKTHRVNNADLATFQKLVNELPKQEFSHLCMTRYEEDSLIIHTNATRGWLMYLREPADGGVYIHDPDYTGDPTAQEFFQCVC